MTDQATIDAREFQRECDLADDAKAHGMSAQDWADYWAEIEGDIMREEGV